jgi:hypothetical protein
MIEHLLPWTYHLPDLLRDLLHAPLTSLAQQTSQRDPSRQRQPHISPHSNRHARIIMAVQLVMLVRSDTRRDMVEHGRRNYSFRIRQRAARSRGTCRWHRVREGNEDQGKSDETPTIIAHVVELEIVGCEVGLRGWAEPADDHGGVVDTA